MSQTQTLPISNPNNSDQEQRKGKGIKPVIINTRGNQTCEEEQRSGGVWELKWRRPTGA